MSQTIQTVSRSQKPIAMRRYKQDPRTIFGRSDGGQAKIDDSQIAEFGRLIYSKCKNGEILTRSQIAELVGRITDKDEISERVATAWISRVRAFFIHEYNETFIYITNHGYKIAQGIERTHQVAKIGHMTVKWRKRFLLTASILSKKELEEARAIYIARLVKDEKNSGLITDGFSDEWKENTKLLTREVKDVQKQLTEK